MTVEDKKNNDNAQHEIKKLREQVIPFISQGIGSVLRKVDFEEAAGIEEIRLRAEKSLMIHNHCSDWFVTPDGKLSHSSGGCYVVKQADIIKTVELMSENSVYAYQDEICGGFITLRGGHRVGITGRVVLSGGLVKNIKDISALNIRLSKEIRGCCGRILRYVICGGDVCNTLVISPPQCGKTTLLRDFARAISDGTDEIGFKGVKTGIVDERSEIAACYKGVPQNNVGVRTDVLDGCPKSIGMPMMVRSMSPRVIITDEIGNEGDRDAVKNVLNAGVKIITSAHGYNISELRSRREVISLIEERVFDRYIVLGNSEGPGTLEEVVDGKNMEVLYRRRGI